MNCRDCEAMRAQHLDLQRLALQLARALGRHERRYRPSRSPSVSELVALVGMRGT
jgi:hypothetical protein